MMMMMRVSLPLVLLLGACTDDDTAAWGTFEAEEVTVASQASGPVLRMAVREGDTVQAGQVIAEIDAGPLALQRDELEARRATVSSRLGEVSAQRAALDAQLELARREEGRMRRLADAQAATPQQVDRAEREVAVLEAQLEGIAAARATIGREAAAIGTQVAQLDDRVTRSVVHAPLGGTVLVRLAEPGEVVAPGRPMVVMAALDTLTFRAWVSGAQLPELRLGAAVVVRTDDGGGTLREYPGAVTWIADRAEFTPTPIQTRDERVTQVYAVKVRVANPEGTLKIGMPGELVLPAATP
jgi:HlyD family secretion protein